MNGTRRGWRELFVSFPFLYLAMRISAEFAEEDQQGLSTAA